MLPSACTLAIRNSFPMRAQFLRTPHRWAQEQIFLAKKSTGEEYDDRSFASPRVLNSVFCNVSMIDNTPYIARGIFVDNAGKDNNHTFCVIGHKTNACYHFSVVECVTCLVVLNNKKDEECRMTERVFADTYRYGTKIHVMNKEQMRLKYKHILWVGPYMVFECIATDNKRPAHISFGAGSYYDYTREFTMCSVVVAHCDVTVVVSCVHARAKKRMVTSMLRTWRLGLVVTMITPVSLRCVLL